MNHVLILQHSLSKYLFDNLENIDVIFLPVITPSIYHRVIRYLYYNFDNRLYSFYFPKEVTRRLQAIPEEDTLIFMDEDTYMCWVVSHICAKVKNKIVYFWNPCSSIIHQKLSKKIKFTPDIAGCIVSYIKSMGFKMSTFDEGDARKYNMYYYPQVYRKKFFPEHVSVYKQEFFFCGRNKGRESIIKRMENLFSSFGKCYFIIQRDGSVDALDYYDYIKELRRSRILCEVVQPGQTGMTVRSLEALFHKKKLITNNINIINCNFYNPNNIFILKEDTDYESIENFLKLPFIEIDSEILKRYDVCTMIENLSKKIK